MLTVYLYCNNESIKCEVLTNSYSKTEILYNNLKQADNSVRFTSIYTIQLANFIKAYIDQDIKVIIYKDDAVDFTGYIRKNVKFTKTQINQPIAIDVVSPSYMLDKTIPDGVVYIGQTLKAIIEDLLRRANFTLIASDNVLASKTVIALKLPENANIKNAITEILYEYGFGFDFDKTGAFYVFNLFEIPNKAQISKLFNGANCVDKIEITTKDQDCDGVRATYPQITFHSNALIFKDTTGATEDSTDECHQIVAAGEYFAEKQFNILDCDSEYGDIVYISAITARGIETDSNKLEWAVSKNDLDPDSTGRDLGTKLSFTAQNTDTEEHYFKRISISADIYTSQDITEIQTTGQKKDAELRLQYVADNSAANAFVRNLTNWYRYATDSISLHSKTNYNVGDFVAVTDYGIGTYYGRIIKKVEKLDTPIFDYTIETIADFTPADPKEVQTLSGKYGYSAIASAIARAKEYTDRELEQTQIRSTPKYDVFTDTDIIKKNSDSSFEPSYINLSAVKTEGLTSQIPYLGLWHVHINGDSETWLTHTSSELALDLNQIRESFDDIRKIDIEFFSADGKIIIDKITIPVLTNSSTYSVTMANGFQTYECDETGFVSEREIIARPRVFYGLQEIAFGPDGWEFGPLIPPAGFTVSTDNEGYLHITTKAGSDMAINGAMEILLYVHTTDDVPYEIGYTAETRAETTIGDPLAGWDIGYYVPGDEGYFYEYFNFQKLIESAVKIAGLSTKLDGYWNELTSDLVITVTEKNVLTRLINELTAEYNNYTKKYSSLSYYTNYRTAYNNLLSGVNTVLNYPGNYHFASEQAKNSFNQLFSNYNLARALLDEQIATTPVYKGAITSTSQIPTNIPVGSYILWGGNNQVWNGMWLYKGMNYKYTGSEWVQDDDPSHDMMSLDDAMQLIQDSTDESIPAVSFAKKLVALKIVTDTLVAKFITTSQITFDTNGVIQQPTKDGKAAQNTANTAYTKAFAAGDVADAILHGDSPLNNLSGQIKQTGQKNPDGTPIYALKTSGFVSGGTKGFGLDMEGNFELNSVRARGSVEASKFFVVTTIDGTLYNFLTSGNGVSLMGHGNIAKSRKQYFTSSSNGPVKLYFFANLNKSLIYSFNKSYVRITIRSFWGDEKVRINKDFTLNDTKYDPPLITLNLEHGDIVTMELHLTAETVTLSVDGPLMTMSYQFKCNREIAPALSAMTNIKEG